MAGSWGDIPPPPGKAIGVAIGILIDTSDVEGKIRKTLFQLPEELRHEFVDGVRGLLLDGRVRCIRGDELVGQGITDVSGSAPRALKNFVFRACLEGLDELCAAALRAAHGDGA